LGEVCCFGAVLDGWMGGCVGLWEIGEGMDLAFGRWDLFFFALNEREWGGEARLSSPVQF
jgi:hypothetical protein